MKHLFLAAALLLMGLHYRVAAQAVPLLPSSDNRPAAVDSAALLHQLFKHERRIGLLGLAATTGVSSGLNALNDPSKSRQLIGGLAIGANTGLSVIMVVDRIKFSHRREREAIDQLQQHQPLRPYVQRSYALALVKASRPKR